MLAHVDWVSRQPMGSRVSPRRRVTLYQDTKNRLVCLNALLVLKGLASDATSGPAFSSRGGPRQVVAEYFKRDPREVLREQDFSDLSPLTLDFIADSSYDDYARQKCSVLRVDTPKRLFLSTDDERPESYKQLLCDMQDHYYYCRPSRTVDDELEKVKVGQRCALYQDGRWRRGEVVEQHEDKMDVRLLDEGMVVFGVSLENLRPLKQDFDSLPDRGLFCLLEGIESAAGGVDWDLQCVQLMRKMLIGENRKCKIRIWEEMGIDPLSGRRVVSGSILVKKSVSDPGPFDIETFRYVDVEKYLVAAGLVRMVVGRGTKGGEAAQAGVLHSQQGGAEWLPPVYPEKREFRAQIQYVQAGEDYRELVFYCLTEDSMILLDEIREKISKAYSGSSPRPQDQFWYVGQPCVVRFWWDDFWYRGRVMAVPKANDYQETYKVQLVDYGTLVNSTTQDMRKDLLHSDSLPIQVMAVKIEGIKPKGGRHVWDPEHVLVIHSNVAGEDRKYKIVVGEDAFSAKKWPLVGRICKMDGDRENGDLVEALSFMDLAEKEVSN